MSSSTIHAGSILHIGGQNVIDRIQAAGLGDVRLPMEIIREVGNREVVDKVPTEPDFTFTMESLNVAPDVEAFLAGRTGGTGSADAPGASDANGTVYDWLDDIVGRCVNIPSPWKDPATGSAGNVEAGHIIPGYYPTRIRYRFGVTENATQEVELSGGSFFYGAFAPIEQYEAGNGITANFDTDEPAIRYRRGGEGGTVFTAIFGVIVDGQFKTEGVDYEVSGGAAGPTGATATVEFNDAPEDGAEIRFVYFTSTAQAYPQSVHASVVVTPGAVRGRNIHVFINGTRIGAIQSAELEGTVEGEMVRELGTEEIVGYLVNGTDCNGNLTIRSRDADSFFDLLERITGVARSEIYGWFNEHTVDLQLRLENPKSPGTILKTLQVADAKFQPPGTPARVNTATDFVFSFESQNGSFKAVKGTPA